MYAKKTYTPTSNIRHASNIVVQAALPVPKTSFPALLQPLSATLHAAYNGAVMHICIWQIRQLHIHYKESDISSTSTTRCCKQYTTLSHTGKTGTTSLYAVLLQAYRKQRLTAMPSAVTVRGVRWELNTTSWCDHQKLLPPFPRRFHSVRSVWSENA